MQILKRPVFTDKAVKQNESGVYVFFVDLGANKIQIKAAVEAKYGVTVNAVNTLRHNGKRKTRFTKGGVVSGKTPAYKKAYVKLAEGEVLDLYDTVS